MLLSLSHRCGIVLMDEERGARKLRVGGGAFLVESCIDGAPFDGVPFKEDNHRKSECKENHLPDHGLLPLGSELGLESNSSDLVHRMMNAMG